MSPDEPLLLGLDLGTSRIKVTVADATGNAVAAASAPTPLTTGAGGRVECAVDQLLGAVAAALGGLDPALRRRVGAVGLAGMAEGGAALDAHDRPASAVISWNDTRGQEAVDRLHHAFGDGIDRAIGQRLRTVATVAKLGWLTGEAGAGNVARWLGVPELVLHALTGAHATEDSLAARTGAYHVGERRWLPEVLEALAVPPTVFPPTRRAGDAMGRLGPDATAWSGLPAGIPVTIAGHDHLAGMVGAGVEARDLANSVGTAETVVGRSASRPDADLALADRVAVTLAPGGTGWALLASGARAGIVVETAASLLGTSPAALDELAEAAEAAGDPGLDLADEVVELAAGRRPPLPERPAGEVWKALLAALVARTADAVDRVVRVGGPPERVVAFGGGTRSRPWMMAKAAALPMPLWQSSVTDAVARGAVTFAGVAAGWWATPDDGPAPELAPVGAGRG